jgi:uncharacterized protein involved in exopolysaccharide biosynthesis
MDPMKEPIPYQPELDPIDWRTSARRARNAVVRHVPLILASIAVSFLLLFAYVRLFPPVFKAEALMQAEPDSDTNRNEYYSMWNLFRKADMKSEPELMTSGRVAKLVVQDLHLKFDDVHHTMLTQIGYLWTESFVGRKYRAFKEWLFPPDPAMYKATPEEIEFARTVDAFRDGIKVESIAGTSMARVIVLAPTFRAGEIANRLIDIYLAERVRMFRAEADRAVKTLETEVQRASADLEAIDRKKFEFDSKNKVVLDFEKDKLLVADWVKLQSSVTDVKGIIAGLEASLAVVEAQLAVESSEVVQAKTMQDSKIKGLMQGREFELNSVLQAMRERYRADSPDIQQIERQLAEIRGSLAKEPDKVMVAQETIMNPAYTELRARQQSLKTQLASAKATLATKSKPMGELETRMNLYPQMVRTITEYGRVREGLESRYKLLRDRLMMADVSRASVASAPASIRIIDYASMPMRASWPRMIILAPSALALGLFLGFGMALLAELFSTSVNRDRLSSRPEYPVYAVIDMRPILAARAAAQGLPDMAVAVDSAIRRLRGPT